MMTERFTRIKGNIFSDIHYKLGTYLYLSDIDFLEGSIKNEFENTNISENTENRLYFEYFTKNDKAQTTAVFDYKHTMSNYQKQQIEAFKIGKSIWYYSQLAKQLNARSFIVFANDGKLPLTFYETTSGRPVLVGSLLSDDKNEIRKFWGETLQL